jgi:hypothetical protein
MCSLCLFTFAEIAWSQSDFVEKGQNGIELTIGQIFVAGKNPFLASIGGSINGKLDIGAGLASANAEKLYTISTAYHIGGENNDFGIALGGGYVIFPEEKNYFVFGPSFYARSLAGNVILVPTFGIQLATTPDFDFFSNVGLGIYTGGNAGLVILPQFVFGEQQSYFSIALGILARS